MKLRGSSQIKNHNVQVKPETFLSCHFPTIDNKGTKTKTIQIHLKCFKVVTVEASAAVCFHFTFNDVKRGFAAVNMSFDTFQHCWCVQVIPGL